MIGTLEWFKKESFRVDISKAVSEKDEEKLASLRIEYNAYKDQMRQRCSPEYIKSYKSKNMQVAAFTGISTIRWVLSSMARTAATCILYHMSDDTLKQFASVYITD